MRLARAPLSLFLVLAVLLAACSANQGVPSQPGQYDLRQGSVGFDGEQYQLLWVDRDGQVHRAEGKDFRLVQDDRDYLEVGNGSPVIHLRQEEPISVQGQDERGPFNSFWFPFLLGQALSRSSGPVVISQPAPGTSSSPAPTTPSYRYPPTDTFGRDESLHGTVTNTRPEPPDYRRVQPAPYAVSGQGGGTGGGTAATSKSVAPATGQAGGTGAGTAASSKGGFKSGPASYASRPEARASGASKGGASFGSSEARPSNGSLQSRPPASTGARSSGGLSGKSSGGSRSGGARGGRR